MLPPSPNKDQMSYAEKLLQLLEKHTCSDVGKIVLEYLPEWGCTCRWDGEYIGVRSATKVAGERILLIDSDDVPKILDYEGKELERWDYVVNILTQVSGIDGGKRIVLASRKDHQITIIDSNGKELHRWSDEGRLAWPCDSVDIERGRMVVVDQYNHRVNVYTREGELLYHLGEGDFRYPTVVARITNNQIAVVDDDYSRIQIFDLESGEFLSEWDDPALEYLLIGRVARFGKRCVAIFDFRSRQTLIVDARSGRFLYWLKDSDEIFASLQDLFVIDENRLLAFDTEDRLLLLERLR